MRLWSRCLCFASLWMMPWGLSPSSAANSTSSTLSPPPIVQTTPTPTPLPPSDSTPTPEWTAPVSSGATPFSLETRDELETLSLSMGWVWYRSSTQQIYVADREYFTYEVLPHSRFVEGLKQLSWQPGLAIWQVTPDVFFLGSLEDFESSKRRGEAREEGFAFLDAAQWKHASRPPASGTPPSITFQGANQPLREILDGVTRQTGTPVVAVESIANPPASVDVHDATLSQFLNTLCQKREWTWWRLTDEEGPIAVAPSEYYHRVVEKGLYLRAMLDALCGAHGFVWWQREDESFVVMKKEACLQVMSRRSTITRTFQVGPSGIETLLLEVRPLLSPEFGHAAIDPTRGTLIVEDLPPMMERVELHLDMTHPSAVVTPGEGRH